ncbi:hypothetical protein RvY_04973 [Ramazzottius varieornatus]|uniref:Secreted protein n=1 Tax=Ramazzottius varieornatus TaxID=947166 RepID=A0A1D1V2K4_RAMVA|nr:hypothetical protein RvY_04973 [Ramazzottius varieornatus]
MPDVPSFSLWQMLCHTALVAWAVNAKTDNTNSQERFIPSTRANSGKAELKSKIKAQFATICGNDVSWTRGIRRCIPGNE